MVQHVGFGNAVEEMRTEGREVAVDCGEGAAGEGPAARVVVGEGRVGVLEVGYCYCWWLSATREGRWSGEDAGKGPFFYSLTYPASDSPRGTARSTR